MIKLNYHCDHCGKPVDDQGAAHEFSGAWNSQAAVAAGGEHQWHSCSGECAAAHLETVAARIRARAAELAAQREAHEKDVAERAAVQERIVDPTFAHFKGK